MRPAGFGKTALLADWARRDPRPVAWLSLDDADNDPARFWRHAAAALDKLRPGVAQHVAALLGGLQPTSFQAVVTTLVNELAGVAEEVVLVLDDYHLIQAPQVHASLGFLIDHLPPQLHLVLASRADPPLPLARLRARGLLSELRERDLRFTPTEAAELLRAAVGPEPARGGRGGAGGPHRRLGGRPAAGGTVAAGSHRHHRLRGGILRQPPLCAGLPGRGGPGPPARHLVQFLLETSVLERLSGPLCEAVTGHTDSQQLLEQIERANLFLHPLDEVRGWWRYHHLFADLLRARLAREQPERLPELHRAAAAWCEQHGLVDDAIRHALTAGEFAWVARLIEQHWDAMAWRSEDVTLRRWLQALPAELVRSRPRLCLAQAYGAILSGRLEAAEPLVAAERALADSGDQPQEPYEPSVGRAVSLLANLPAAVTLAPAMLARLRGDAERTAEFAQQALTHLTDADRTLRHFARYYLAMADWLRGRLVEAEHALAGLAAEQVAAGARYLVPLYHDLGQVRCARGHLGAALRTYEVALGIASKGGRPLPPAGIAHVDIAEVLYERGGLDAALDHATQGVALSRQLGWARQLAAGLAILAWIRQARGDRPGAMAAITEAGEVGPSPEVVDLFNPLPALRVRLALAHGETADAARWVQQRGLGADDEPSYLREREYLVLVRVLLAQQAPQRALGLLDRLHALAAAQGRTGSVIEARALQALALSADGDQAGALGMLAEALTLGAPEGYLRVFVDEGPPMAALLHQLLAGRRQDRPADAGAVPREHLARLVEAFEQAGLPVRAPAGRGVVVAGLVEPLTAREVEVLQLLAGGAPNRAIAEQLVVTPETVKKHLSHLFDKLGAANRTQAVARARELGLLP